jgi:hypothetical protein
MNNDPNQNPQDLGPAEEVKIGDISEIGQRVPKGRYRARLSAVNGKMNREGTAPMVEAIYDVQEGDQEGMDITIFHSLKVTTHVAERGPSKGQRQWYAPGIIDMKAAMKAVGKPIPEAVTFNTRPTIEKAHEWARVYGQIFGPQNGDVEIVVIEEPRRARNPETGKWDVALDEDGRKVMTTRAKVVGKWKGGPGPVPSTPGGGTMGETHAALRGAGLL